MRSCDVIGYVPPEGATMVAHGQLQGGSYRVKLQLSDEARRLVVGADGAYVRDDDGDLIAETYRDGKVPRELLAMTIDVAAQEMKALLWECETEEP